MLIVERRTNNESPSCRTNCPGCGARVSTAQKECDWCHKPIVISTFNSVYSMPMPEVNKYAGVYRKALTENPDNTELNKSIAMCYLKLKMYDKALEIGRAHV